MLFIVVRVALGPSLLQTTLGTSGEVAQPEDAIRHIGQCTLRSPVLKWTVAPHQLLHPVLQLRQSGPCEMQIADQTWVSMLMPRR